MLFQVKKLIGYWILPVPFCVALVLVGFLLLALRRRIHLGRGLVATGAILLVLFSNKFISHSLVRPLEHRYAPVPNLTTSTEIPAALAKCRYVVALGAGHGHTPGVASINLLSVAAHARIVEAVRILRALPEAKLLVSGPHGLSDDSTHATVLSRSAISLGMDPGRIVLIEKVRDTEDEAGAVKQEVGEAPVAVVTSAAHMPRSMALFHSAGVNAFPCPTDYTSHDDGRFHWRDFLFDVESLQRSTWAIRERVGYLWISLRGKTRTP